MQEHTEDGMESSCHGLLADVLLFLVLVFMAFLFRFGFNRRFLVFVLCVRLIYFLCACLICMYVYSVGRHSVGKGKKRYFHLFDCFRNYKQTHRVDRNKKSTTKNRLVLVWIFFAVSPQTHQINCVANNYHLIRIFSSDENKHWIFFFFWILPFSDIGR